MKLKNYTLAIVAMVFLFAAPKMQAQCDFNPTITGNYLICDPSDNITLQTQTYDAYQWYQRAWHWDSSVPNPNPWIEVAGATGQSLTINAGENELIEFKVAATLGSCTEESPLVLIDGFAYGLPYMISTFQEGTFEQIDALEYNICSGATVTFNNGYPVVYGTHTWYKCIPSAIPPDPNDPCIMDGVIGDEITVSTDGNYGFYACTEYCPNLCNFLGTNGFIKLNFGDFGFCALGTDNPGETDRAISLYPNPTVEFVHILKADVEKVDFSIIDASGKIVRQEKNFNASAPINVSNLASGVYILSLKDGDKVFRNRFVKN